MHKKMSTLSAILFSLIFLLIFFSSAVGQGDVTPDPLMTPGAETGSPDPNATAAVPSTGNMPMGSMTGMSSGGCPMLTSGMAGTGTGMSGDAMLSGSMAMPGMSGMGSMSMPGMSDMSGMTGMSMQGTSGNVRYIGYVHARYVWHIQHDR